MAKRIAKKLLKSALVDHEDGWEIDGSVNCSYVFANDCYSIRVWLDTNNIFWIVRISLQSSTFRFKVHAITLTGFRIERMIRTTQRKRKKLEELIEERKLQRFIDDVKFCL